MGKIVSLIIIVLFFCGCWGLPIAESPFGDACNNCGGTGKNAIGEKCGACNGSGIMHIQTWP